MNDFAAYLDEAFAKLKVEKMMESEPEPELPKRDVYREIRYMIISERKKHKMTQKQLAEKTGLSQANISNIEKGNSRPTIDTLMKIADAFGKQLAVYFEESEEIIW